MVLTLRMSGPISDEVLDASSDEVLEAVERHVADLALGPVVAVNFHERAIELRFDVVAPSYVDLPDGIKAVLGVVIGETDIPIASMGFAVEAGAEGSQPGRGEFAP